jgi:hypothetical protein
VDSEPQVAEKLKAIRDKIWRFLERKVGPEVVVVVAESSGGGGQEEPGV